MRQAKEKKDHKEKKSTGKRHPVRRFFKYFFLTLLALAVIGGIVLFVTLFPVYQEYKGNANEILMNMDETTFRRAGNTTIYDRKDKVIGRLGNEKYEYVDLSDVSDYVIDGYIIQEDQRFYEHGGVDIQATIRAALALIQNKGEITQGGSTITQQVVKNNLLSQEQTYSRKILEMMLALQLEKQYSKNQIMEFYVNSCYYGNNCYGIEGASEYYFDKSAKNLTLSEAAMLVATSNSPSTCNPVADYDGIIEKRNDTLKKMLDNEDITQEEYDAAVEDEPEIIQKSENTDADNYMISYALHCTVLELMDQQEFQFEYVFESGEDYENYQKRYNQTYNEIMSDVRSGGYDIYTSFNQSAQKKLQKSVDSGLKSFKSKQDDGRYEMQGAAACIDNETGMVIAMVGGRGTSDSYNRGYQAARQPGSSIKPLLDYGPGINEGYITPASVITDEKITVNGYSPKNSGSYYGDVTAREALARSLNTVAFQIFLMTGRDTSLSYLEKMQFSTLAWADSTVDSISVGGFTNGVSVADMAKGYATLANQGTYTDATCLRKVVTESGKELYNMKNANETQVYLEDTAFMLTDMMEGVFKESYGTAHSKDTSKQCYAGKTGTTNDCKDAWFCGYSPYYTTVVWTGCDNPQSVDGLYGNSYPLSIWSDFMTKMHEKKDKQEFEVPKTIYLENKKGKTKKVTYTKDVYKSRPKGYDYVSEQLKQLNLKSAEELKAQAILQAAKDAVEEFEAYQITSNEDAVNLEPYYNQVVETVNEVEDVDERTALLDRAAYKYGLLADEVVTSWADAEKEIEELKQKETDAENKSAAQQSLKAAQQSVENEKSNLKSRRISVVNNYISSLNNSSYYTDSVAQMIANAKAALEDCVEYSEYSSLKSRLDSAISRAQSLPTYEEEASRNKSNNRSSSASSGSSSSSSSNSKSSGSGNSRSGNNKSSSSSSSSNSNNNTSGTSQSSSDTVTSEQTTDTTDTTNATE